MKIGFIIIFHPNERFVFSHSYRNFLVFRSMQPEMWKKIIGPKGISSFDGVRKIVVFVFSKYELNTEDRCLCLANCILHSAFCIHIENMICLVRFNRVVIENSLSLNNVYCTLHKHKHH